VPFTWEIYIYLLLENEILCFPILYWEPITVQAIYGECNSRLSYNLITNRNQAIQFQFHIHRNSIKKFTTSSHSTNVLVTVPVYVHLLHRNLRAIFKFSRLNQLWNDFLYSEELPANQLRRTKISNYSSVIISATKWDLDILCYLASLLVSYNQMGADWGICANAWLGDGESNFRPVSPWEHFSRIYTRKNVFYRSIYCFDRSSYLFWPIFWSKNPLIYIDFWYRYKKWRNISINQ